MSLLTELKKAFEAIAVDDAIGDPSGKPAYAYMRVSTPEQAEEGRSGIPRQVQHIHEVAQQQGYRIAWEQVFTDDDSGYEFRTRAGLTALRREYKNSKPYARAVVMEHLDRLSRNADWHQGFLLDEMKQYGIEPVFWKSFSSRIERAVMGAIAQDGMEQSKQRMMDGTRMKAQNGRVTGKTRNYGYKFVDSQGREGVQALKDTHYAIVEHEAWIVKQIFDAIAYSDKTIRAVALGFEGRYPPPKRYKHWDPGMIRRIIRNPVYKGEFVAHRYIDKKVMQQDKNGNVRMVRERVERPPEEWIIVPVPAIVDSQTWEVANQRLDKNQQTSSRNAKHPYLLTGLLKCATCGYAMGIKSANLMRNGQRRHYANYVCSGSKGRLPERVKEIGCDQLSNISCRVLEKAVWSVICTILLDPEVVIGSIDRRLNDSANQQVQEQIDFLTREIASYEEKNSRLLEAYLANAFDAQEFAEMRRANTAAINKLVEERQTLDGQLLTPQDIEKQKQMLLEVSQIAKEQGSLSENASYEFKRKVIHLIVD